ncbi:RND transporter [Kosmotoga arenicorallina S304]|uniref:RND transporter n=1 Tax=Kosmotoga arenicorallina S304 TaxID=1453497 RepID=A0A176K0S7_9BACT|nr:MMPL family transporter [Kosmotoga arenicorallina]OAA30412.1 RND transporter [Kosmotoga arenicorallina S304]
MRKLASFVINYKLPIIAVFIFLAVVGGYYASKLVVNSDLMKILPPDDPVIKRYKEFMENSSTGDITYVVLKTFEKSSQGIEKLKGAARALFDSSKDSPYIKGFVKFDYLSELGPMGLVLVDPEKVPSFNASFDLSDNFEKLLNYEFTAIHNAGTSLWQLMNIYREINNPEAADSYESYIRLPDEFPEEDPMILVMGLKLNGTSADIDYVTKAIPELKKWIKGILKPFNIDYSLTGDHFGTYESYKQANRDFAITTIISLLGIALLFYAAYSSLRITLYIFLSLIVAMLITLGIAYLIFGELNIVTTFVNAITLGLGIDYGIHMITRLSDESKRNKIQRSMLTNAYSAITKPLLVSMVTTALVFVILALINAPAVRELGVLTSIGISVFFAVMYLFLPAISLNSISKGGAAANIHSLDKVFYYISGSVKKFRRISLTVVILFLMFLSYLGISNLNNFSYTPPGLMAEKSEMLSTLSLIERVFKASIANTVPFIVKPDELKTVYDKIKVNPHIGNLFSLMDLVRGDEEQYLSQFKSLVKKVNAFRGSPVLESLLKKAEYYDSIIELIDKSQDIENPDELINFVAGNLPASLKKQLIYEAPDGEQYFVINAEPKNRIYRNNVIKTLFDSLGDLQEYVGGYPQVFYYLMDTVKGVSFPLSLVAIILVFIIVWIDRRNIYDSIRILILMSGILIAMFGLMEILGIDTSFITIISAPLIIGIGVDSLVHMIHSSSSKNPYETARTLKSVAMSSATTILAFSSFAFAQGKLLRDFGLSMAAGVFIALVVATMAVPVLPWKEKNRTGGRR